MPFIIDGHNLLWAIHKTNPDQGFISEIQLCRIINSYLGKIDDKAVLVFDGTGPKDKSGFDNISNLEVIFSGVKAEADDVIKDKIKVNTAPKRLAVVSNDRVIRDTARRRKAVSVKSEAFWLNVERTLKERKNKPKEPPQKRAGLSEGETEQWLEFFGIED
ncbi:MAG: NYN domain-containing protein [Planctomycetota bacterium]|jgi:predicted RNA-binding protein with PIN domain